jgi:hypothetical protein
MARRYKAKKVVKAPVKAVARQDSGRQRVVKAPAPVKPTAEQRSDHQRQAALIRHMGKIKPLTEAKKRAGTAEKKAYDLAEADGVTKLELATAFALENGKEGIQTVKDGLECIRRVARWLGYSEQLELFGDKESKEQRHYEDGRRAALGDFPASPPEHLSHRDAQTWLGGHAVGRLTLNAERARGFSPLSDAAKQIAEKAGVAASLDERPVNPKQTWLAGTPAGEPGGGEDAPFVQ